MAEGGTKWLVMGCTPYTPYSARVEHTKVAKGTIPPLGWGVYRQV